jgi:predicted nucleic acid-binding protein
MARQRRRLRSLGASPARAVLVLDSGALTALASGAQDARAALTRSLAEGRDVVIPAVVLAESTTGYGPRDAPVNRVVNAVDEVVSIDEPVARLGGALRYESACDATVDALVVAIALAAEAPAVILTGDAAHLERLSAGKSRIRVQTV